MKNLLLITAGVTCFLGSTLQAQDRMGKKASLLEDGTISVENVILPAPLQYLNSVVPENLFSFGRPASPSFKNQRGVTLADLDNDGVDEIIYGMNTTLYALKGDGTVFWSKPISGTIVSPVAVADMNGDGSPEIALNTWQPPGGGRVYLMDQNGADLPNWPLNFANHYMFNSPVIADVDSNGTLDVVTCERVSSSQGFVHALNYDGSSISANWPVELAATPAFTPSVGDLDNDGDNEVVIASSSAGMYIFNSDGSILPGFPLFDPAKSYSYQSPLLVDLDGNESLEIVGSNHGDAPGFYVLNSDATYYPGWPIASSGWIYSPPTVADINSDGTYDIFMGDRNTSNDGTPLPSIYGFTPDGENLPNFPIFNYGGNEGVLTIADINNDDVPEIIFSSVLTDNEGYGYLHAYSVDGSGEIDGFPLRPRGYTFLNGAVVGDVNDDGMMDLTANSYTQTFGASVDSTFVNVYNLNVPYDSSKILSNGYKGSNTRDGLVSEEALSTPEFAESSKINIHPNPSHGPLAIQLPVQINQAVIEMYSIDGKLVFSEEERTIKNNQLLYDFKKLQSGIYLIKITAGEKTYTGKWIKQ